MQFVFIWLQRNLRSLSSLNGYLVIFFIIKVLRFDLKSIIYV